MPVKITIESALQDDVRNLVALLNMHLEPLSPIEHQYKLNVEEMAQSDTIVFVARDGEEKAIGMAALKSHTIADGGNIGEVKRMFTIEEVRGKRIGSALLERLIAQAKQA